MSDVTVQELRTRLADASEHYDRAEQAVADLKAAIRECEKDMYAAYQQARAFADSLKALGEPDVFEPWRKEPTR